MAREMTPQERSATQYTMNDLFRMAMDGKVNIVEDKFVYASALQQTRRAALEEAKLEIEKCIDYSGGCVGTRNDPHVVAVNRFIELTVGPLLDRLREGVGT